MGPEFLCIILNIAIGALGAVVIRYFIDRHHSRREGKKPPPFKWNPRVVLPVAMGFLLVGSLGLAVQSERTHSEVQKISRDTQAFAERTRDCQRQFQAATASLIAIGKQDRDLTLRKEEADGKWLSSVLSPPAEIVSMSQDDPRRREYNIKVSQDWSSTLADVKRLRAANETERSQKQLPPIDCGEK